MASAAHVTISFYAASILVAGIAGINHMRHLGELEIALRQHRLLPKHSYGVSSVLIALTELLVSLVGLVSLTMGSTTLARWTALAAMALFVILACYSLAVLRRTPNAPCGCSSETRPTNVWVPIRTACLGIGAYVGSLHPIEYFVYGGVELTLVSLAALAIAAVLWELPSAMHIPNRNGRTEKYAGLA